MSVPEPIKLNTLILATVLSIGCASNSQNLQNDLVATFNAQGESITAEDVEAFVSYYSDQPFHLPPGAPQNKTPADIAQYLSGKLGSYDIQEAPVIRYSDDATMAFVFGKYTTKPSIDSDPVSGRFITVWQRLEDEWKCSVDIWNSSDTRYAHD